VARLLDLGVDFDHWCFACGRLNPSGLQLDFDVSANSATARYTGAQRHQGYDGTLHGGVVTALLDETMGWAIFHQGIWGVTVKLEVTFRRPVPVGEEIVVSGRLTNDRGRTIETKGTVTRASDGTVLAEATAIFMRMPDEQRVELEKRYSRTDEAFARVRAAVAAETRIEEHART
jgi:acyl-coenzyme A thioesterase PaaI-like protein